MITVTLSGETFADLQRQWAEFGSASEAETRPANESVIDPIPPIGCDDQRTRIDLKGKARDWLKAHPDPDDRASLQALFEKFGAANISEVPDEKLVDFGSELESLA